MTRGGGPEPRRYDVDELRRAVLEGRLSTLNGPFQELVGYHIRHDPAAGVHLELEVGERHMNPYGIAHGGVTLTLLDAAGGVACFFAAPDAIRIATIGLAANFVRGVPPGRVVATAHLDGLGGAVAHASLSLRAGGLEGDLLATATASYRLFRERAVTA